jgi:hypothetical protein
MSGRLLPIHRLTRENNRSGCPRNDFLEGDRYSGIPRFRPRLSSRVFVAFQCIGKFRTGKTVWTLPSLWTQRTRPQVTWKTAQTAVFHSVHTDHFFFARRKETTKNAASVPI